MRPLIILRAFVAIVIIGVFSYSKIYCQQITFSDSLGSITDAGYCSIVGKINKTFIIIESLPGNHPHVLLFDTGCALHREMELSFIPAGGFIRAGLLPDQQTWSILWQSGKGKNWYLYHTQFDENSMLLDGTTAIDSAEVNKSTSRHPFSVKNSTYNNYQLLFRKIPDSVKNQQQIDLVIIPLPGGQVVKAKMDMPFNKEFDESGDLFIDETGNVYTTVYDHPLNFRFGSRIYLYQYIIGRGQINFPPLLSNGKKPVNIQILPDSTDHHILLMSLYTDFYSKNVDGVMGAMIHLEGLSHDSLFYYTFSKEEKKQVNRHIAGIARDKLMNYFELKQCFATSDNRITLLLQLSHNAYGYSSFTNALSNPGTRSMNSYSSSNGGYVPSSNIVTPRNGGSRRGGRPNMPNINDTYPSSTSLLPPNYSADNLSNIPTVPGGNQLVFGNPNIPVAYVCFLASFDGSFNLLNKKVLQAQVTSDLDYIAPFITIKNGQCSRFTYEGTANKPRLKKTDASLVTDEIRENTHQMKNPFLLLLDHPSLYMDNTYFLTFYHNRITGSYGLAKYSW